MLLGGTILHGLAYDGVGDVDNRLMLPGFLLVYCGAERVAYDLIPKWYWRSIRTRYAGHLDLRIAHHARFGGHMGIMFTLLPLGPMVAVPEYRSIFVLVLACGIILLGGIIGIEAAYARFRIRQFFTAIARTTVRHGAN